MKKYYKVILATAVAIAVPYIAGLAAPAFAATFAGKVVIGAVAGGLSGAISTGSLKGALIGAVTGAAFAAVGNLADIKIKAGIKGWGPGGYKKIIAHGLVGGIRNKLSGRNFLRGFLSGGFTQSFAPGLNQIAKNISPTVAAIGASVVGGAASVISGGKFKDGFWIGIGSYVYNELQHNLARSYKALHSGFRPGKVSLGELWEGAKSIGKGVYDGVKNFFNSFTPGQRVALGKIGLGSLSIGAGTTAVVGGFPIQGGAMIAGGVVSVKDGVVSAYIEWGLGGDTSPIPPTYYHLGYEIYKGINE